MKKTDSTNKARASRRLNCIVGRAWAWAIREGNGKRWLICNWAHPTKEALDEDEKPSPEARKVWVKIVPANDGRTFDAPKETP